MTPRSVRIVLASGLLLAAAAIFPLKASAAPMLDPGVARAADTAQAGVENARWVCGPWRCWWRPNYYYPHYRPWGYYHRPWGYGYGYGWHRGYGWHGGAGMADGIGAGMAGGVVAGIGWHGGWHHGWRR